MKYLYNPATDSFEALEPTLRDRFMLGGRVNFDRGGLAQVFDYLESLPKGTELSISDIMKYVEDNNIDVVRSTLESRLQSPESKMFSTEEKIRNKNILKNIKLKVERPNVFGDITTKRIKEVFENPTEYPDQKSVSKGLGYKSTQSKSFLKNLYESRVGPLYDYRFDLGYRPDYGTGKKISEAYQNQLKLYGKSNLFEIGKQIFPNRDPFNSQKIVKNFVKDYEGYVSPEPLPRKKGRPDRSKIRRQKLFGGGEEKISSRQVEAQLSAPKESGYQMHHGDATKIKNVTLNNLFYIPERINNFLQKAEGPVNKIEKEIQDLIEKKPKNYKTKISAKNAQAMNLMTKASNDLKKLGFERYSDLLEFNTIDESGKPIKLGGKSANRSLAIFAEELGVDPNKPIKNFTQAEINKVKTLRDTYLIPEDKKLFDIDVKRGADYEKVTGPTYKKSKGTSKLLKALKAAKPVAKALPVIGTAIGLYDVNKALQAGITDPRDLYAAYEVSAEIAAKQKAIREDPTGKLLKEEIANLPEITTDDQVAGALMDSFPNQSFLQYQYAVDDGFQGSFEEYLQQQSMKMARGGRVGFQNGTPNPVFDQIIAALDNPDLIKNLEEENKQTLKEQVYGDDGDRTLMQTFNTMFADPKAYPYYAQELASGAANIPELMFRFPFAVTGLASDLATGRGNKLERAMETLDPKLTRAAKEKIGFSDMLEESRTKRTGPQRTTGGILKLAAEIPGPATPYFLIKAFPKIAKQIKNIVGSDAAARKVNEELEKRLATDTVDQTRRDILLATGAGGAVALLKFLGLDSLVKTTKVAKAAPEIVTKGGTPKYFFDFVNLIKSKGDDISDKAATVERQKVYDYNGYTLYEDMTTGKISIRKDTEGGATYSIGDGEYETVDGIIRKEEIIYDPPETIVGKDGKPQKVPDMYEENTLRPDYDGSAGDAEGGLDSIDEILELLAKDGNKYSLKELKEMGINPEALGSYKPKKAEGGIIAGVSSGPPPKSGPTPHGLPYVAKNVRPITERK